MFTHGSRAASISFIIRAGVSTGPIREGVPVRGASADASADGVPTRRDAAARPWGALRVGTPITRRRNGSTAGRGRAQRPNTKTFVNAKMNEQIVLE
jgi:hypothetical protein